MYFWFVPISFCYLKIWCQDIKKERPDSIVHLKSGNCAEMVSNNDS